MKRLRATPALAALLWLPGCTDQGQPLGGGLPVIEPGTPAWNDLTDEFLLFARVSTAASGEEISDAVQVSVAIQRLKPGGGFGEVTVLPASKLEANPLSFQADATGLEPQMAEQFRFWWGASRTMEDGTELELAKTDPATFQVDCPDGPEPTLRDAQFAVTSMFPGPVTEAQINAQGYVLHNHGYPSTNGIGVNFRVAAALSGLNLEKPPLLLFDAPAGSNKTDHEADEPYTLIGWAYGAPILLADQPRPRLECIPYHEWFIHEAGWHTPNDGGMVLDPPPHANPLLFTPQEAADLGANPAYYHPRIWDLHLWLQPGSDMPRLAIYKLDSQGGKDPSGGVEPPDGIFFYP